MFGKIVVGTDGSDTASVAVSHAAALAEKTGAELLVVHAYEPERGRGESPFGRGDEVPRSEAGRSILAHEEKRLADRVSVRTFLEEGNAADAILDVAEAEDADLVVVGNVGMSGARRFMGSVPNNVSHHSPTNVLIVNTRWAADAAAEAVGASPRYGTVLMATDGSGTASRAMEVGAAVSRALGASVVLVHVGDEESGRDVLDRTSSGIGDGLEVRTVTAGGQPAEAIVDVAEREGADLIVVGNKGMTGAKRFLLGSVPNAIAHHASTDVLIAKTT